MGFNASKKIQLGKQQFCFDDVRCCQGAFDYCEQPWEAKGVQRELCHVEEMYHRLVHYVVGCSMVKHTVCAPTKTCLLILSCFSRLSTRDENVLSVLSMDEIGLFDLLLNGRRRSAL